MQALLDVTPAAGASLGLNLLPPDASQCPKIADNVQATINGRALSLSDSGGWRSRKGGAMYCEPPRFDGAGIPLSGDATIVLHDATADFSATAPGALRAATITLVQPADGALHPGQSAQIQLSPHIGTATYARVSFVPTAASTSSFYVEYPGSGASLSGDVVSFSVPAAAPQAAGSLQVTASLAVATTVCQGPASCAVQTGVFGTVAASVAAP
jgi:hypothetical protein